MSVFAPLHEARLARMLGPRVEKVAVAPLEEAPCQPEALPPEDPALYAEALDDLRARLTAGRTRPLDMLLLLGDATMLAESVGRAARSMDRHGLGAVAALLARSLRQAAPLETRHLDLVALQVEAVRALLRLDPAAEAGAAADLLPILQQAVRRELPGISL